MSHSLFAYPVVNAQAVLTDEAIFATYAGAALNARAGGGIRFTIFTDTEVTVTVHVTPEGGTAAAGAIPTAVAAGGVAGFVLDIPRGADFDVSVSAGATVSIFAALVLGAVA